MPMDTAIWRVSARPKRLRQAELPSENVLEELVVADPSVLSEVDSTGVCSTGEPSR